MIPEQKDFIGPSERKTARRKTVRAFDDVLDGFAVAVIVFMLLVVVAAYLLELKFNSGASLKDVGIRTALLYVSTVTVSILLRVLALRKGRRTDTYKATLKAVEDNNDLITDRNLSKYRADYCKQWEDEELDEARKCVLSDVGIELNDFKNTYCKHTKKEIAERDEFKKLTQIQRKAIEEARKIKRLKYDVNYLSVNRTTRHRRAPSGGLHASDWHKIKTAQTLAVCLIMSVFAIYIGVEASYIDSWSNFVACMIKVTMMIISGVLSFVGGYYFAVEKETAELNEKAHEQKNFINWCEREKGSEK